MADTKHKHQRKHKKANNIDIDALPLLIDVATAAAIRGNSEKFIRDQLVKGEIQGCKLGQSWRINTAAFLEQCGLV